MMTVSREPGAWSNRALLCMHGVGGCGEGDKRHWSFSSFCLDAIVPADSVGIRKCFVLQISGRPVD